MTDDPESHKNEGILKSIWHTLTNNAAHQKANEADAKKTGTDDKSKSDKADDGSKKQ